MTKVRIFMKPNAATFESLDTRSIIGSTVILDIDGTIAPDAKKEVSAAVVRAVESLAARNSVYLFSNHTDGARNRTLACRLGLEYLDTPHRKPSRKIIEAIPSRHRAQPIIVIGDKTTIDGLFARRIGAQFIRVGRVLAPSDQKWTKLAYFLDDLVTWIFARGEGLSSQ